MAGSGRLLLTRCRNTIVFCPYGICEVVHIALRDRLNEAKTVLPENVILAHRLHRRSELMG